MRTSIVLGACLLAGAGNLGRLAAQTNTPCCHIIAIDTRGGRITIEDPRRHRALEIQLTSPHSVAALALRVGTTVLRVTRADASHQGENVTTGGQVAIVTTEVGTISGTLRRLVPLRPRAPSTIGP